MTQPHMPDCCDMDMSKPVVVGFDSSPDAALALRWAASLAQASNAALRVVIARGDLHTLSAWADDWSRGLGEEWVELARKQLEEIGMAAEVAVVDGLAAPRGQESAEAAVVVVGSRGHGALLGALLGSVSQHVSRHAKCPVVVTRLAEDESSARVVVGVDGSAASFAALDAGIRLAEQRGQEVTAICVPERWQPHGAEIPTDLAPELVRIFDEQAASVRHEVEQVFERYPGLDAQVEEVSGSASRALVEASGHAALVVVGSRGRGAFSGLLLGSVSADVLRHARCAVMIVR